MSEKRGRKKRKTLIILIVILVLILVLFLSGFLVAKSYLDQIGRTYDHPTEVIAPEDEFFDVDETPQASEIPQSSDAPEVSDVPQISEPPQSGEGTQTSTENPVEDPGTLVIDPETVEWSFIEEIEDDYLINILLVGQDGWKDVGRQRSDTMMLCSINPETGEVALISFLRDLYVQIPGGYSDNRLNVPYVFGGFPLLDETLEMNFGVSIDANVEINFQGFEKIVDHLGGIEVNLSAKEVEYIARVWGLEVREGINHFDGKYALNYVRMRKLDSDFGRTSRQRTVMLTLYSKIKDLSGGELLSLLQKMLPYVTTDLTDTEILSLAYRLLPLVSSLEIGTYTVPASNAYTRAFVNGMDVLVPNRELIRDQLENEYLPLN